MLSTNTGQALRADVHLHKNLGIVWRSSSDPPVDAWAKGFAFHDGTLLDAKGLGMLFAQTVTAAPGGETGQRFAGLLCALNGNFAVVVRMDGLLFAAVDRLRSILLFYGEHDGTLCVSDDAFWVKEQVRDTVPDPLSVKEFMLTGYVTGSDTLFPNVKQLQAGECLHWTAGEGRPRLSTHRYYRWIRGDYADATQEELCAEMDCMHLRVFERLLESTEGRTIVVPLSGGHDSRLIVTMLKRLGREDVICFSYGRPGNRESEVSRRVAETLGYPWRFVPYSRKSWRVWYNSAEWQAYSRYACGLCSLPHLQDWPAVWVLREQGQVPDDAVFIPGHSVVYEERPVEEELVIDAILRYHYSLFDWAGRRHELYPLFRARILRTLGDLAVFPDNASAFESWDVAERQPKFITNSLRVYEFWGYDWRVPLWDNEMMAYWTRVPLHLRVGKRLYKAAVAQVCGGVGLKESALSDAPSLGRARIVVAVETAFGGTPFWRAIETLHRAAGLVTGFWSHPMAWYGINSFGGHLRQALRPDALGAAKFCINSLLVKSEAARVGIDVQHWSLLDGGS